MPDALPSSSTTPSLQVAVIYNPESKTENAEIAFTDDGVEDTAAGIADSLRRCGYQSTVYAVSEKNLYYLKHKKADVFFNVCEGEGLYMRVVRQLAKHGRVFTGPGPDVMALTVDKIATKEVFERVGVPTPKWQIFRTGKEAMRSDFSFPLIVKPTTEDCSIGITEDSIVYTKDALYARIQFVRDEYKQSAIVEEFIPGKEIHCTIVGNDKNAAALPLAELAIEDDNFIFDYEAKWVTESPRYKNSNLFISPAPTIDEKITKRIQADAKRAFLALGMKDYARFDVRYNMQSKKWYFLEANANPSIQNAPAEATIASASAHGLNYHQFIKHILDSCTQRSLAS